MKPKLLTKEDILYAQELEDKQGKIVEPKRNHRVVVIKVCELSSALALAKEKGCLCYIERNKKGQCHFCKILDECFQIKEEK